ncbi:MAG: alpha/beta fold hydrolase, partial [Sandaracinaceae bacterium]
IVGDEGWARWERDGELEIPDAEKRPVRVHYGFVEEARTQPAEPEVTQPTVIVHGVRDAIVPIAFSRAYASSHPNVRLVEVDDDHALGASIDRIEAEVRACFELG